MSWSADVAEAAVGENMEKDPEVPLAGDIAGAALSSTSADWAAFVMEVHTNDVGHGQQATQLMLESSIAECDNC